jgi:hypothetical protein
MFPSSALLGRSAGTQLSSRFLEMRKPAIAEPRVGQDIWSCTTWCRAAADGSARIKEDKLALFSRDIKTMDDLFLHTLRDIYYAEKQIVQSLPEMMEQATDAELKRGFQGHLKQTENHLKRLEQVFENLGEEPKGVDCPAIDGIIDEAEDVAGGSTTICPGRSAHPCGASRRALRNDSLRHAHRVGETDRPQ